MSDATTSSPFRLSTGGLFYALLRRAHFVRDDKSLLGRRTALFVLVAWLPLVLLCLYEGTLTGAGLPFLGDPKPYVRYLVALPLLIFADAMIDPLIAGVIRSIGASSILPEPSRPRYQQALDTLARGRDSYLADAVILGIVALTIVYFIVDIVDIALTEPTGSWMLTQTGDGYQFSSAGWWFVLVSGPLLQILLYRWLWRFWLWFVFLFRLSRIRLTLEPTHPDLAGGLGMLKNGQNAFYILFFAFGALLAAALAEDILYSGMTLVEVRPIALGYVVASLVINSLPLAFFARQLIRAKYQGRRIYGALAHALSRAFDEKWAQKEDSDRGEKLLQAMDPSAMADYTALYENVREMRFLPINPRDYIVQAGLLSLPFLLLIFTKVPLPEVLGKLFKALI